MNHSLGISRWRSTYAEATVHFRTPAPVPIPVLTSGFHYSILAPSRHLCIHLNVGHGHNVAPLTSIRHSSQLGKFSESNHTAQLVHSDTGGSSDEGTSPKANSTTVLQSLEEDVPMAPITELWSLNTGGPPIQDEDIPGPSLLSMTDGLQALQHLPTPGSPDKNEYMPGTSSSPSINSLQTLQTSLMSILNLPVGNIPPNLPEGITFSTWTSPPLTDVPIPFSASQSSSEIAGDPFSISEPLPEGLCDAGKGIGSSSSQSSHFGMIGNTSHSVCDLSLLSGMIGPIENANAPIQTSSGNKHWLERAMNMTSILKEFALIPGEHAKPCTHIDPALLLHTQVAPTVARVPDVHPVANYGVNVPVAPIEEATQVDGPSTPILITASSCFQELILDPQSGVQIFSEENIPMPHRIKIKHQPDNELKAFINDGAEKLRSGLRKQALCDPAMSQGQSLLM
ncbi:hypothetical protein BDQ17DRAFT_1433831 [Cyathus striatus]|nr:hypothetical protein BDQ17DRAFT_1433831 [Cyathus striatus]